MLGLASHHHPTSYWDIVGRDKSPQRRADRPARAAAPKDSDRHAGRRIKTSRKTRTQPRFGFDPPALDFD
jgi:hypothetical protein